MTSIYHSARLAKICSNARSPVIPAGWGVSQLEYIVSMHWSRFAFRIEAAFLQAYFASVVNKGENVFDCVARIRTEFEMTRMQEHRRFGHGICVVMSNEGFWSKLGSSMSP